MSANEMAAAEVESPEQVTANMTGATLVKLASSWWGNEKFGSWSENWWVLVDAETEKAIHCASVAPTHSEFTDREDLAAMRECDVWLPKSQLEMVAVPSMEEVSPNELDDPVGEVSVLGTKWSEYGQKAVITGDTYALFKGEGNLHEALPCDGGEGS